MILQILAWCGAFFIGFVVKGQMNHDFALRIEVNPCVIEITIGNAMNTKYMTFVLAGIFIGITAILQISYANSITTVSSLRSISMIFQPLMGVLIAFAIQEWCNLTLGVFISQFTLSMMFNALIALGVPSKMQDVVLGVMLIIVMGIALNNKRISGFFERKARRKELMKRA